ncbi:MAG: (2Fe-2S)-binding protein [Alphaproteobacteria bacterium]|nr:(2Fe-2S)-binding protein [Alphaproteobacteria bacterium]
MYICLCNALTDRDLRSRITGDGASVSMVYRACGCTPQCGKCVPMVRDMLREACQGAASAGLEGAD